MFDFEKLEVYQKAKSFNKKVRTDFLKTERVDRNTQNQLSRASMSIMLNIAEGSGRFTKPDKKNFYIIARGSLFECVAIFDLFVEEGVITKEEYQNLYNLAEELSKMLFSLIRGLGR